MRGFSIFTAFSAKDGMTPVFSKMEMSASSFEGKLSRASKNLKNDFGSLKNSIMSVGTGLGAIAVVTPFKMFSDWEKGILSVNTLMSKTEISEYGDKLKNISKEAIKMNFAVEDANKGLFDTVSALGVSDKSIEVYRKSAILAKGGVTELSIAIDGMTSVINAYGRETTDANRVANSFFTAQKYGKTTVEALASNIGKVAPAAKAANIGYEEVMSTMAALTLGGLSTEDSATALKGAINALVKPSKEAGETLRALGIPVGVTELRAKGLSYALIKVNEAQKKNPNLLAKAIPNIRAYTAAMALSEDKLKIIDTTLKAISSDVKNGTGLNEAFETMSGSASASIGNMFGELRVAAINLGDALAPTLLPLVKGFANLADKLGNVNPEILQFFGTVVLYGTLAKPAVLSVKLAMDALIFATTAYGALSLGVIDAVSVAWWAGGGTIAGAIKAIGINMLWTAKTGITSLLTGLWGIMTCPVTWVAIGIASAILAIGAGFIYAYTHCEGFRKIADSSVKGIMTAFNWLCEKVLGIVDTLFKAWDGFWKWLTNQEQVHSKPDLTGFDMRKKTESGEFDFNGTKDFNSTYAPIISGLSDKGSKNDKLQIEINNNTPYPATASGGSGRGYNMQLAGNFAQ